ncbi:MAG: DUF86 domain-containing protein [Anaerolineae bacterium]|nr:DUF86 domain-containing protein [Anaerolineae bacterium]
MVGFRNTLVHQYQDLDIQLMMDVIENHLDDLIDFTNFIVKEFRSLKSKTCRVAAHTSDLSDHARLIPYLLRMERYRARGSQDSGLSLLPWSKPLTSRGHGRETGPSYYQLTPQLASKDMHGGGFEGEVDLAPHV